MDLADLRYVTAAGDSGNFTRAAKGLGVNAPTISRCIGRLEDEPGLTLFERSRADVRLTASGEAVMRHVRRVLADVDAVKSAGHHHGLGTTGEIRLGVRMPPIGGHLGDLLQSWHHRYANVNVELRKAPPAR
jgi:DNA-binding transcriptional LysR family regulator